MATLKSLRVCESVNLLQPFATPPLCQPAAWQTTNHAPRRSSQEDLARSLMERRRTTPPLAGSDWICPPILTKLSFQIMH